MRERASGRGTMWRGRTSACWVLYSQALLSILSVPVYGFEFSQKIRATPIDVQYEASETNFENEVDFDYFIFSQQWPGTYCLKSGTCCSGVTMPATFTVHGVWPENEDGSYPSCCDGPHFDQEKIDELTDLLQQYWPSMSCSSPTQCNGKHTGTFWQHEWEKHGTCSYPIIPDEATYFTVGLNLRLKYDITAILNRAGFIPSSNSYKTSEIVAAIQKAVGAKPYVTCSSKRIYEVWVCLTKDLKIRDCVGRSNSCSSNMQIPPFEQGLEGLL